MFRRAAMFLLPLALVACNREEAAPPPAPSDRVTPALERLAARAEPGTLGAMILDLGTNRAFGINIDKPLPMQSVFKLPLGIFVLHKAERGELGLDRKLTLTRDQLSVAHSPIADRFDEQNEYTVEELVRHAVSQSDNTAADILLKLAGGPEALTRFFQERGVEDFRVDRYEYELQPQSVGLPEFSGQWVGAEAYSEARKSVPIESQKAAMTLYLADPRDRLSARAAVQILALLDRGRLLSPTLTAKMMQMLCNTSTGPNRLKAGAPDEAIVFHKTGTGSDVERVNSATHDIGIIELPDRRRIAVAVLLSGTELPLAEREKMIAEVARLATTELAAPAAVP